MGCSTVLAAAAKGSRRESRRATQTGRVEVRARSERAGSNALTLGIVLKRREVRGRPACKQILTRQSK